MSCYLCSSKEFKYRTGEVRDDKRIKIKECKNCSLVYLSDCSQITDSFYEESQMHDTSSLETWNKETDADDKRRYKFIKNLITNKDILDFGSGNGGFLRYASQSAKNISALEIEKAVSEQYKQYEIELFQNIEDIDKKFDVITLFHVMEHLADPRDIIIKLSKKLSANGKMIIEVPNSNDALLSIYENNAFSKFTYWSCHLFLFNAKTLENLIEQCGLKVDFIKHIQRYPLSNHLYWLSKNKPGGHQMWGNFIDSQELSNAYETQLASIGATDTLIAQVSLK